ncbi:MAG TPA: O-antigen ligase family protein [Actinomycetota bacterium]|nr:O-antigen ligase family protein [Actinomycetota bacterium]
MEYGRFADRLRLPTATDRRSSLAGLGAGIYAVTLLLVLAGALGVMSAEYGSLAVFVAIVVLLVGLASTDLALLPVLAFPATLVMIRTGPLSVSDLVLIAAVVPALLLYRRDEAKDLQPLIWAGIAYQAFLVPTLILNPYLGNYVEWVHELFLVVGSLVVGWVIGRRDKARVALSLFTAGCVGIAIAALMQAFYVLGTTGTFGPAYLPFLHKNFIGNSLAFAFLIAFVRPDWLRWSRGTSYLVMGVCAAGIAASNSRQAIVSVFAAVIFLGFRGRTKVSTRGRVLTIALIPAIVAALSSVGEQLESGDAFNSTAQRLSWYAESLVIWRISPMFGVGLRWWNTGDYSSFQPPNAFLEMLSSGGLLGLIGFIVLCVTSLWIVLLLPRQYSDLASAIMIARFAQGQLDLFWVAGQSALPWMVAGLVIGVRALHYEWEGPGETRAAGFVRHSAPRAGGSR